MRAEQIYNVVQGILNKSKETDPFKIAENLGIFIRYDELGKLLGMYAIIQKCRFIIINQNLPYLWKRIVCAHDLWPDVLQHDIAMSRTMQEFGLNDLTSRPEVSCLKLRNMNMRGIDLGCNIEPEYNILGNVDVPIIKGYEII